MRTGCLLTLQKWPKVGEYDHRIIFVQVYNCMFITAVFLHRVGLSWRLHFNFLQEPIGAFRRCWYHSKATFATNRPILIEIS